MFHVAICDDEMTSLTLSKALTEKILNGEEIEYTISTFSDMESFLKSVRAGAVYNVLLADILMTGKNGIEAAGELRSLHDNMPIVFVSSTDAYALEGYRVNALRYLKKPVSVEALREALMCAHSLFSEVDYLNLRIGDSVRKIKFSEILYAESRSHELTIHTKSEDVVLRMSLSELEAGLPAKEFVKIHRSYIVNLQMIQQVERYNATLSTGDILPIAQGQFTEVKNRFVGQ